MGPCTAGAQRGGILGSMPDGSTTSTPVPGVVVVWSGANPTVQAFRIPPAGLVLGRELLEDSTDDRISRQHARVMWKDKRFLVTDLGSRNGTYAGGHALVDREVTVTPPSVVRTGRTVSVLLDDVRKFEGATVTTSHDAIIGASTARVWQRVEQLATDGTNLVLLGEPGSGKGRMARRYAKIRNLPEAVYNPTIQAVPLERIVGPTVETLILEQVGKLGKDNLATLVKLLETRPELRVVTTAVMQLEHLGIPADVAHQLTGKLVHLPPLRDRPDEMAYLVHDAVRAAEPALQIHSTLVEACLLRPWPGNSRELVAEVSRTAHTVAAQGKNNIRGEDLDNDAGHLMVGAPTINAAVQPTQLGKQLPRRRTGSRTSADND
jgi:pSer/pThr/pTyr-binding forkhead associated (FHA) protein